MEKGSLTLQELVSINHAGRLLFLALPPGIAGLVYALALALGVPPEFAPIIGAAGGLPVSAVASWLLLDEPAAICFERTFERAMVIGGLASIPAFLLLGVGPAMACIGTMLVGFGASVGIVRIAAYSDAPEPPEGASTLAMLAWMTQMSAIVIVLCAPTAAIAAIVSAAALAASIGWAVVNRKPVVQMA